MNVGAFFEDDGLLGQGADFLADDAGLAFAPGDAAGDINGCAADDGGLLLLQAQLGDRAGRADLAAGIAGVLTLADAGDEHRSP